MWWACPIRGKGVPGVGQSLHLWISLVQCHRIHVRTNTHIVSSSTPSMAYKKRSDLLTSAVSYFFVKKD